MRTYRPTFVVAMWPAAAALLLAVLDLSMSLGVVGGLALGRGLWWRRGSLVLDDEAARVRFVRRTRVVPWSTVTGVRRGDLLWGGVIFDTVDGPVRSRLPSSWSGPARPEDVGAIRLWWQERAGQPHSPAS